jgi:hypothetical protein
VVGKFTQISSQINIKWPNFQPKRRKEISDQQKVAKFSAKKEENNLM